VRAGFLVMEFWLTIPILLILGIIFRRFIRRNFRDTIVTLLALPGSLLVGGVVGREIGKPWGLMASVVAFVALAQRIRQILNDTYPPRTRDVRND